MNRFVLFAFVILACVSARPAVSSELNLVAAGADPILVDGESLPSFSNRVRMEITCLNLQQKLTDYQASRADLDRNIASSVGAVTNALYRWDSELYRIVGRTDVRYTGALGRAGNELEAYNLRLQQAHQKLQAYIEIFSQRMTECSASS